MRLLPFFSLACSEYSIQQEEPTPLQGTDTAPPDSAPPQQEACALTLAPAGTVDMLKKCIAPTVVVADPWSVELEWQWAGAAANEEVRHVIAMPAIGNLTDDDGDGLITEVDVPDVVFIAGRPSDYFDADSRLMVLDGATGEEHWSMTGLYWMAGVTLADADSDGAVEILTINSDRQPVMISATGEVEWTASVVLSKGQDAQQYPSVLVADLWGDGSPEVIADVYVLDGRTGALLSELSRDDTTPYTLPTIGDIDQDGEQEIVLGSQCFSPDGTVEWTSTIAGDYGHWSVIADVDGDSGGEVVMIGAGLMGIYDGDGTELLLTEVAADQPGPPCLADFDGDGAAELAWANSTELVVYELDGTPVWQSSIVDESGLAACSGYDVNGDGAYEVLYADEQTFTIFDGLSGQARYTYSDHTSGTVWEYPVVADIDGDLSAEIVFASNDTFSTGGWSGITALGHSEEGWLASGPTWHVHDFAVTNINPDGTVPITPDPPWQVYNIYRARPAMDRDMGMDLEVEITDICFDGCAPEDTVHLAVQVSNRGVWPVPAGLPVSVFSNTDSSLRFISLAYTDAPIGAGASAAGMELTLQVADLGTDGITVRADELGAGFGIIEECDEDNNADQWSGACE